MISSIQAPETFTVDEDFFTSAVQKKNTDCFFSQIVSDPPVDGFLKVQVTATPDDVDSWQTISDSNGDEVKVALTDGRAIIEVLTGMPFARAYFENTTASLADFTVTNGTQGAQ